MTTSSAVPLPVLYLAPDTVQTGPPHPPGSPADLLLSETAACVAAVGHRLHVAAVGGPCTPVGVEQAVARWSAGSGCEPVLVVIGRLDPGAGTAGVPEAVAVPSGRSVRVVAVALDGAAAPALTLPGRSRSLCRILAHSGGSRPAGALPGRALVLVHRGSGPEGDDDWPGLSWGLTLLMGGPGRGVLLDAQGPAGGLRGRLRSTGEPVPGRPGVPALGSEVVPVPGPAFASRLPAAGGVRWWSAGGWAECGDRPPAAGPALLGGLGAAVDTFHWTVLDVGRDLDRAAGLAAAGLTLLDCAGPGAPSLTGVGPVVELRAPGPGTRRRGHDGPSRQRSPLAFAPGDWTGRSWGSWARAARRRPCLDLAVRLAAVLPGRDVDPSRSTRSEVNC